MLAAACATAAEGEDLGALERALGCPAGEAAELLAALLADLPDALRAAFAVWVRAFDATAVLDAWTRALPVEVESGAMPTQAQADAWIAERTFGLIERFPLRVDALRIVLVAALDTMEDRLLRRRR